MSESALSGDTNPSIFSDVLDIPREKQGLLCDRFHAVLNSVNKLNQNNE